MGQRLAQNIWGSVQQPAALARFGGVESGGIGKLLQVFVGILIALGVIWAFINLILAGYQFMSAGDDTKKVAGAWSKIWQTLLGLALVAGSFVLAAIFGQLIFGDPGAILAPKIPTP
jgi:hypothetical protein